MPTKNLPSPQPIVCMLLWQLWGGQLSAPAQRLPSLSRERHCESQTQDFRTGTGNPTDDTWLIRRQLLQSGKAADLPESSVTKVGPSAAGEEAAVTTRKGETRKHRDAIHKLWLPSKEPRMARIINCVIWVSLRACLASSSTGSGVPFVFSEVPPSLHTVSSRVFNPHHCGKCANKHTDKAGI